MKPPLQCALLAAGLAGASMPGALALTPADQLFTDAPNASSGFVGYHVTSINPDPQGLPFGISFDLGTTASYTTLYEMGVERTYTDFSLTSHPGSPAPAGSVWNQFRLRLDTGQVEMGPQISHPISSNQLNITAGHDTTPIFALDGLGVSINGASNTNINLTQRNGASKRTSVTFGAPTSGFQIGTDSAGIGTNDWYLKNLTTGAVPLEVYYGNNVVNMEYGANVTGTLTVAGALTHTGSTLGFYGTAPVSRPSVTGCRSDGTALKNLLQALQSEGLIVDNTTP